jgi:hypothetical protein
MLVVNVIIRIAIVLVLFADYTHRLVLRYVAYSVGCCRLHLIGIYL